MDNRPQQPQSNNDFTNSGNFTPPNQADDSNLQQPIYSQPPQDPQNLPVGNKPDQDNLQPYPADQNGPEFQNPQNPQTFPIPQQPVQSEAGRQQTIQSHPAPPPNTPGQTENRQPQNIDEQQSQPQIYTQPTTQDTPVQYQQLQEAQNEQITSMPAAEPPQAQPEQYHSQQQAKPAYDTIETTPHPQLHPAGDPAQPTPAKDYDSQPQQPQQQWPNQNTDNQNYIQPGQQSWTSQDNNNQDYAQTDADNFPQLESHLPPIGPSAQANTSQDGFSQSPEQLAPNTSGQVQVNDQAATQANHPPNEAPIQSINQTEAPTAESQVTSSSSQAFVLPGDEPNPKDSNNSEQTAHQEKAKSKESISIKLKRKVSNINYKPIMSAAIVGMLVFGVFNSQVILGQVQYLTTPSGGVDVASIGDADTPVGDESRMFIPLIDVDVPIVDEPSFDEDLVQAALENGVVHYGNTAQPGEIGNSVIVGHSSNDWWDAGDYKYAFILLDRLQEGNEIIVHHEGTRYVYEVTDNYIVEPTDLSVLEQPDDKSMITLITCTPPGTSWQRLIVEAEQISPDPADNIKRGEDANQEAVEELPRDSGNRWFNIF